MTSEVVRRSASPVQPLRLAPRCRPDMNNGRLLLLACSEKKAGARGRIPAYERYDGPLWQTLRVADPHGTKATVAFLSARFGFRSACDPIECYDTRLSKGLAERMISGGVTARWPEHAGRAGTMPWGSHAAYEIASLTEYGRRPFRDVALVGGHLYLEVMRSLVQGFRDIGHVMKNARILELNDSIGLMRQRLRAWLDESEEWSVGHDFAVDAVESLPVVDPSPSS